MPSGNIDEELFAIARLLLAQDGLLLGLGAAAYAVRIWWKFFKCRQFREQLAVAPQLKLSEACRAVQAEKTQAERNPKADSGSSSSWSLNPRPPTTSSKANGQLDRWPKAWPRWGQQEVSSSSVAGSQQQRVQVSSSSSSSESSSSSVGSITASDNLSKKLVVLRGKVQASKASATNLLSVTADPAKRLHDSPSHVIVQRIDTMVYEELHAIFGWMKKTRQIGHSLREVPFCLSDSSVLSRGHAVHVSLAGSSQPLPLTSVYSSMQKTEPSLLSTTLHVLIGQRLPVGLHSEERALRVGTELTAVGHLTKDRRGNAVITAAAASPVFLSEKSKDELLAFLAHQSSVLLGGGIAVTAVAAICIGVACFKGWKRCREHRAVTQIAEGIRSLEEQGVTMDNISFSNVGNSQQHSTQQRNAAALVVEASMEEDVSEIENGELCVVCLMRRRRAVFIHCGHRVCCGACAMQIKATRAAQCPICREDITGVYRVFDS